MILNSVSSLPTVLDLPSGFGRVTRHLTAFMPESDIYVADLNADGAQFCRETMGATVLEASESFDGLDFGRSFDLIWSGSLLTHLALDRFTAALNCFARLLSPEGIAVVTLHGRHSPYIQHNQWKYISDERFAVAEASYLETGFGYVDYPDQRDYGISLSGPSFTMALIGQISGIRMLGYHERRWNDHQDVLIFAKSGIDD